MCFSAEMDAIAGLAVTGIGIDAVARVKKREHLALAALPVVFGVHQLIETFVWLGLEGQVGQRVEDIATWVYLLIAVTIVPALVPLAFLLAKTSSLPRIDAAFLACGITAAAINLSALGLRAVPRYIDGHQITYHLGPPLLTTMMILYVTATCGPPLASRVRGLQALGLLNLGVVGVLVTLNREGVISLWCVWAAITSVLINRALRQSALDSGVLAGSVGRPAHRTWPSPYTS